ncbi:MAG TPA: hypothetical protein PLI51_01955 [bacterium]|nr:hypothetical protein [bacterium]HPQ65480.1 hypothetical protein [bacterium]
MKTPARFRELILSASDVADVRRAMRARIEEGLAAPDRELKSLPTYLSPPVPGDRRPALALDLGGTNLRAAVVEVGGPGPAAVAAGPVEARIPETWSSPEDFFDWQARVVLSLSPPARIPVGYCFSYPTAVTPERDAVLIRWTKHLRVPGVEGRAVGKLLEEGLRRRGFDPGAVTVLNDTVAALMGGYVGFSGSGGTFIGLVIGTGTNLAAIYPTRLLKRRPLLRSFRGEKIAVNLEAGNFHPPHLSSWDELLDRASPDPGTQRLEKAVAGAFLPRLFPLVLGEGAPVAEMAEISRRAEEDPSTPEGTAGRLLLERAGDLMAAVVAGTVDSLEKPETAACVLEGSTVNRNPLYRRRLQSRLETLLDPCPALLSLDHSNLIGAAASALAP